VEERDSAPWSGAAKRQMPDYDAAATAAAFTDLIDLMAALRAPAGCPWDQEQTHASIARNAVEEAYEVKAAIEDDDEEALKEELGDLLLQVVFHAEMAAEAHSFTMLDVVDAITAKLVRRHPHVFGAEAAFAAAELTDEERAQIDATSSAGEVLDLWDYIKIREKRLKAQHRAELAAARGTDLALPSLLDDVPRSQPALMQAQDISRKAVAAGFEWEDTAAVWQQVADECAEFAAASTQETRQDEMGDILFSLVNVARREGLDAEQALVATCQKFRARWRLVELLAREQGKTPDQLDRAELERLWDKAKAQLRCQG
jgi:tetrapyrrole methylase family protein / MazG family protein